MSIPWGNPAFGLQHDLDIICFVAITIQRMQYLFWGLPSYSDILLICMTAFWLRYFLSCAQVFYLIKPINTTWTLTISIMFWVCGTRISVTCWYWSDRCSAPPLPTHSSLPELAQQLYCVSTAMFLVLVHTDTIPGQYVTPWTSWYMLVLKTMGLYISNFGRLGLISLFST